MTDFAVWLVEDFGVFGAMSATFASIPLDAVRGSGQSYLSWCINNCDVKELTKLLQGHPNVDFSLLRKVAAKAEAKRWKKRTAVMPWCPRDGEQTRHEHTPILYQAGSWILRTPSWTNWVCYGMLTPRVCSPSLTRPGVLANEAASWWSLGSWKNIMVVVSRNDQTLL